MVSCRRDHSLPFKYTFHVQEDPTADNSLLFVLEMTPLFNYVSNSRTVSMLPLQNLSAYINTWCHSVRTCVGLRKTTPSVFLEYDRAAKSCQQKREKTHKTVAGSV